MDINVTFQVVPYGTLTRATLVSQIQDDPGFHVGSAYVPTAESGWVVEIHSVYVKPSGARNVGVEIDLEITVPANTSAADVVRVVRTHLTGSQRGLYHTTVLSAHQCAQLRVEVR